MTRWIVGVFLAICVGVAVYIYWPRPVDECNFMSRQKSAGVDFSATVRKVELAKGTLNLTANDTRDLDRLANDYAMKFETCCRDHKMGVIKDDEYNCRRQNMDRALDSIRTLNLTLEKAAPGAVDRTTVVDALQQIRTASASDFSAGCGPSLAVDPSSLIFSAGIPERSVRITNPGNRVLVFAVDNLPESFIPTPTSGRVEPGTVVSVSIVRTLIKPAAGKLQFIVKDNYKHEVPVSLDVAPENADLYDNLANTSNVPADASDETAMQKALETTDRITPDLPQSSAARLLIAANILSAKGNPAQGSTVLARAVQKDASIQPRLEYLSRVAPKQYKLKPMTAVAR